MSKPHLSLVRRSFTRRRLDDLFQSLHELDLGRDIYDREIARFGIGASSDVFRARSKRHDKLVAVKCIRVYLLEDESFAKALEREVRLWSRLVHPNVLPLLGFYLEGLNAIPNLVSEWMANGTVTMYMRERPFDASELVQMLWGIASGLVYLHLEKHIIHSDLKGSNILVADDVRPLLADFGLSIFPGSSSLAGTTGHGEKGSIRWMAIELFQAEARHTTQTDIWAFGMVICELLTGDKPYAGTRDELVGAAIVGGQLPDLEKSQVNDYGKDVIEAIFALRSIAHSCWKDIPPERPSAEKLLGLLDSSRANLVTLHKHDFTNIYLEESESVSDFSDEDRTTIHTTFATGIPSQAVLGWNFEPGRSTLPDDEVAQPLLVFSKDARNMDKWARRTGIPLTSATTLGVLYARAHGWFCDIKDQLVQKHDWREQLENNDSRMLFSIERTPPVFSLGGMPRSPTMRLQLPLQISTFFSPERNVAWEMVFHSATFPMMRQFGQPVPDIVHILQCILPGLLVFIREDPVGDFGGVRKRVARGLPPRRWIVTNEKRLLNVFGISHYNTLLEAAGNNRTSFMVKNI